MQEVFQDCCEPDSRLAVSVHPNGVTFIYGQTRGETTTLVVLSSEDRKRLALALVK